MAREKLILVPSKRMDRNGSSSRGENNLVRMSQAAREYMGYEKTVEVYPETEDTNTRLSRNMLLNVFRAYTDDLRELKRQGFSKEELKRVGFVTSEVFNKVTGGDSDEPCSNIWITDSVDHTIIGADPEFLMFDSGGNIVDVSNYLPYNGPLGYDHVGAVAEIRPAPAIKPEELVANIKSILADTNISGKELREYDWKAGCYHAGEHRAYCLGGHIHIGNPAKVACMGREARTMFFRVFNKILDELVALPLIKIDGKMYGSQRRRRYGHFGGFRMYEADGRMEYRTLSGMWLMHPTLTEATFGVAKAVIDEVYRYVSDSGFDMKYISGNTTSGVDVFHYNFKSWESIPLVSDMRCTRPSKEMIKLLSESDDSLVDDKYLKSWYKSMKSLSSYERYGKYVDNLYEILKNDRDALDNFDKELKRNWLTDVKFLE